MLKQMWEKLDAYPVSAAGGLEHRLVRPSEEATA